MVLYSPYLGSSCSGPFALSSDAVLRGEQVARIVFHLWLFLVVVALNFVNAVWEWAFYRDGVCPWAVDPVVLPAAARADPGRGRVTSMQAKAAAAGLRRQRHEQRVTSKKLKLAGSRAGRFISYWCKFCLLLVQHASAVVRDLLDLEAWLVFCSRVVDIVIVFFTDDDIIKQRTKVVKRFSTGECGTITWRRTSKSGKLLTLLIADTWQRLASALLPVLGAAVIVLSVSFHWFRDRYRGAKKSARPWFTLTAFCVSFICKLARFACYLAWYLVKVVCYLACCALISFASTPTHYSVELQLPGGGCVQLAVRPTDSVKKMYYVAKAAHPSVRHLVDGLENANLYFELVPPSCTWPAPQPDVRHLPLISTSGPRSLLCARDCGILPNSRLKLVISELCGTRDLRPELCRCSKASCKYTSRSKGRVYNAYVVKDHMFSCGQPYTFVPHVEEQREEKGEEKEDEAADLEIEEQEGDSDEEMERDVVAEDSDLYYFHENEGDEGEEGDEGDEGDAGDEVRP